MRQSRFNFLLPLSGGRNFLVNTFSGAMDFVPQEALGYLSQTEVAEANSVTSYLSERRYFLEDSIDEMDLVRKIYGEMLSRLRQASPLRCVFLLSFRCNLRCTYCWQQHKLSRHPRRNSLMSRETISRAFEAIDQIRGVILSSGELPPVVQLFGGEPLLPGHRDAVEYILERCDRLGWPTQITTNGVYLRSYLDLIERYGVREVQVTVDGPSKVHDQRRLGSRFEDLMTAMDLLLQKGGTYVKLRTNLDLSNVDSLPPLADSIIDRQWYANRKFYSYLAPLRDSGQNGFSLMRSRSTLLAAVQELTEKRPKIGIFDLQGWDSYQAVVHLHTVGRFPYPRPHICEANVNQFVFNPMGEIHVCAEEANNPDAAVGRFTPGFRFDWDAFQDWYNRSPLDLPYCDGCPLIPVCGGGCQLWLKHRDILPHFCRASKEVFRSGLTRALEMGDLG